MPKSPAFLFYTNDFMSGTLFFTDEQVGKLMRLLCAQHQHGHLTRKQVFQICRTHDSEVMAKFATDAEGKFYNKRLELETEKRNNFSESRHKNLEAAKKKKKKNEKSTSHMESHMDTHMDAHMDNENINDNVIVNEKEKGVQGKKENIPTLDEFLAYAHITLKGKYLNYEFSLRTKYQAWKEAGWIDGNGNQILNWKTKLLNTLPHLKEIEQAKYEPPPIPIYKRE